MFPRFLHATTTTTAHNPQPTTRNNNKKHSDHGGRRTFQLSISGTILAAVHLYHR